MMLDQANRTFICSVVFVDLVGYTKKSVADQIAIKDRFTALLSEALKDIAVNDRIILDTGDGAAMSFLGDPEDALFVAMSLRDRLKDTPVLTEGAAGRDEEAEDEGLIRIGINLGPVKLIKDINGHPNIIGDGINVAQRIMSFARPGQIVVSRSYYDVVSCLSEEYAKLFKYEGSRTDKHVREHEIYVVGESESAFKAAKSGMENRAAQTNPRGRAYSGGVGSLTGGFFSGSVAEGGEPVGFLQDRRKLMFTGGGLALVVVLLAVLVLTKKSVAPPPPVVVAAVPTAVAPPVEAPPAETSQPGTGAAPVNGDPAKPGESPKVADAGKPGESTKPAPGNEAPATSAPSTMVPPKTAPGAAPSKTDAKTEIKPDAAKPEGPNGTVNLAISPWGEVFVNGKSRGVSPPMKMLKLAPGKYKIEVRNTTFAPHSEALDVKAREEVTIRHKFQ